MPDLRKDPRRRWPAAAAASLMAHGLGAAVVLRARAPARAPAPPSESVVVDLVEPSVPSDADRPAPPAPARAEMARRRTVAPRARPSVVPPPAPAPAGPAVETAAPRSSLRMRFDNGPAASAPREVAPGRLSLSSSDPRPSPPPPPAAFDFRSGIPPPPAPRTADEELSGWLREWQANPHEVSGRRVVPGAMGGPGMVDLGAAWRLVRALFDWEVSSDPKPPRATVPAPNLDAALSDLASTLRAIWGDTRRPPAERRGTIFALWDECMEGDEASARAGRLARSLIVAFIRREIPATSSHAYTAAELAAFNATRASHEPFRPY